MTTKEAYEYILMELNKVNAPSLHLEDYNYFMTKGVQEYVNERYQLFETSQQLSDDLQALTVSVDCTLGATQATYTGSFSGTKDLSFGKKYASPFVRVNLPDDYFHLLGCSPTVVTRFPFKCYNVGYEFAKGAKKLTADVGNGPALDNAYLKPSYKNPYYQLQDNITGSVIPDILIIIDDFIKFTISKFNLDYLKKPQPVNLTVTQRDNPVDNSAILEFPEYACHEIIKRTVKLLLEKGSDPRLSTHIPVNQTIR